jgi:hypothetical protein
MMHVARSADMRQGSTITTAVILSSESVWTQDGAVKIDVPYLGEFSSLLFPVSVCDFCAHTQALSSYIHRS